jgi:hypothetical protein
MGPARGSQVTDLYGKAPLIILPPRAYQVVIRLQFDADARDDAALQRDIMRCLSLALDIAGNVKQVGIVPVAPQPPPGS